MTCPLCERRKARRDCPALGRSICSVCCGTKRLVEIACPDSCVHLTAARANPAAVVRKQYEADLDLLLPTVQALTERQHQLFFLFQSVITRHQPDGFARLSDADVADATGAVAATLETAARGVIYEHPAQSPVAKKLAGELTSILAEIRKEGGTVYDGEAAITLRAIENGARSVGTPDAPDAYLTLMGRLLQVTRTANARQGAAAQNSIILP
jgi:hypothetical protein